MTLGCSLKGNSIGGYYDDDDEFHADLTGVEKLASALKINGSLRELKYVCQCSPRFALHNTSAAFDAFAHMLASCLLAA